jgi:peptidoglycan/xylan/chitin deacetylase (PgdA/CDA1 family)
MGGQVMLTFDDGLKSHRAAGALLAKHSLVGVFGVITDRIGTPIVGSSELDPAFLTEQDLLNMREDGHIICNHSARHLWSGLGEDKPGKTKHTIDELTVDCLRGKTWLDELGCAGDCLIVPYGTGNVVGPEHLTQLLQSFRWIRMTIGYPVPSDLDCPWRPEGGKRIYPRNYDGSVVGISAAADIRYPKRVIDIVDDAITCGGLAVIAYHDVADPVGSGQDITWEQFESDIDWIAKRAKAGELEMAVPPGAYNDG